MKVCYLSGPMSNLPAFNFPAFHAAAKVLREMGFEVVNPAEMDEADDVPVGERPWSDCLKRDLIEMLQRKCTVIAMLPGWENSRGARLEHHVAEELGFEVILLKEPSAVALAQEARAEVE